MRTSEEDETISGVRESNFNLGSPVDANAIASAQKIINEKSLHAPGSRSCVLVCARCPCRFSCECMRSAKMGCSVERGAGGESVLYFARLNCYDTLT